MAHRFNLVFKNYDLYLTVFLFISHILILNAKIVFYSFYEFEFWYQVISLITFLISVYYIYAEYPEQLYPFDIQFGTSLQIFIILLLYNWADGFVFFPRIMFVVIAISFSGELLFESPNTHIFNLAHFSLAGNYNSYGILFI